ncbi:MAG: sigma-54-dependent transcriptional regulator [Planctomycetota bacterium]
MASILVVDDESNMRHVLAVMLSDGGHSVAEAGGVTAALREIESRRFDLVITDQRMPDGDGLSLLAACSEADPTLPVILLTAYATIDLAVDAMRKGAFDFITKPFTPDSVLGPVARAVEHSRLRRENLQLRREVDRLIAGGDGQLIGQSEGMNALRERVARVAPTNASVLISGETGVGKELVARGIHAASLRSAGPFIADNCSALTETLLESELFGHDRGAFTGADRARPGLFESAHLGTLFLDEAGEMSPTLQAKLLRVLVDGQVTRVGATHAREVDVRIICASHRDLAARVREGAFREDLFYRIAVVPIHVPALRERPADIPLLVEYFLKLTAVELNAPSRRASAAAVTRLCQYAFPGNVRELRNLIERACILATGEELTPADFPLSNGDHEGDNAAALTVESAYEVWLRTQPERLDLRSTLEQVERDLIMRALDRADGVQAEAGRMLGISRSDMAYKVRKYAIPTGGRK